MSLWCWIELKQKNSENRNHGRLYFKLVPPNFFFFRKQPKIISVGMKNCHSRIANDIYEIRKFYFPFLRLPYKQQAVPTSGPRLLQTHKRTARRKAICFALYTVAKGVTQLHAFFGVHFETSGRWGRSHTWQNTRCWTPQCISDLCLLTSLRKLATVD
jgi:hypothetical protein